MGAQMGDLPPVEAEQACGLPVQIQRVIAGEDAGGAHGANRLGGNGVANSTVYGGIAGDVMGADVAKGASLREPDESVLEAEVARAVHPLSKKPGLIQPLRQTLQDVMWDHVGVMRTAGRLENGRPRRAGWTLGLLFGGFRLRFVAVEVDLGAVDEDPADRGLRVEDGTVENGQVGDLAGREGPRHRVDPQEGGRDRGHRRQRGRRAQAVVFFVALTATYLVGMWLADFTNVSPHRHPFYFAAYVFNGAETIVATVLTRDLAPTRVPEIAGVATKDIGIVYTAVASLLNVIVVMDAWGRAVGLRPRTSKADRSPV